jgi:hypothetical protein
VRHGVVPRQRPIGPQPIRQPPGHHHRSSGSDDPGEGWVRRVPQDSQRRSAPCRHGLRPPRDRGSRAGSRRRIGSGCRAGLDLRRRGRHGHGEAALLPRTARAQRRRAPTRSVGPRAGRPRPHRPWFRPERDAPKRHLSPNGQRRARRQADRAASPHPASADRR